MSLDLSWLWQGLQTVSDNINSWFNSIWQGAQQIANVGQGIYSGLVSIGSALWHALIEIRYGIENAFSWLVNLGVSIEKAFESFGKWLWQTLSNIPNALYSIGNWLFNSFMWLGQQIANLLAGLVKWLFDTFNAFIDAVNNWFGGFVNTINEWFTNQIKALRNKIKKTIVADVTLHFTWKRLEKLSEKPSIKGFITAPFTVIGYVILGEIVANVIDAIIPVPQSRAFELIPSISLPKPSISEISIPQTPTPTPPQAPTTPAIGYGLPYDLSLLLNDVSVEAKTGVGKGFPLSIYTTYVEANVGSSEQLSLTLNDTIVETTVA